MILKEIKKRKTFPVTTKFPYNLPLMNQLQSFKFDSPITIFVGDNGTGKSTLLEMMAYHADLIQINGESMDQDSSFKAAKTLTPYFKMIWKYRSKNGFFFRAESFTSFIKNIQETRNELEQDLTEIKKKDANSLEALPYARSLNELKELYGDGLELQSHGESFISLFQARMRPNGLYILDEPESPLSPIKQLSLISLILEMIDQGCQFIIATHSPIMMALPNAKIYNVENGKLNHLPFDEVEHVQVTKRFLDNPKQYLRHL